MNEVCVCGHPKEYHDSPGQRINGGCTGLVNYNDCQCRMYRPRSLAAEQVVPPIGPQRAAPKSVRAVEAESRQVRNAEAETQFMPLNVVGKLEVVPREVVDIDREVPLRVYARLDGDVKHPSLSEPHFWTRAPSGVWCRAYAPTSEQFFVHASDLLPIDHQYNDPEALAMIDDAKPAAPYRQEKSPNNTKES
jgi:hypothetical protein